MSADEKWFDPNAAQPVRRAARTALIAGLVALVVPNMIQVAEYHSIITALLDDLRLLGDHPDLLSTTILDVARLGLVLTTIVLAARWLNYTRGRPRAWLRIGVGVATVLVAAFAILAMIPTTIMLRVFPLPLGDLAAITAGAFLIHAGRVTPLPLTQGSP
jgi:hypothetical protein